MTLKLQFAWQGKKRQLGYAVFKFSRTISAKKAAETSSRDFVFKVQQFPEMHYLKIENVLFSQVWLKLLSARVLFNKSMNVREVYFIISRCARI